MLAAGRGMSLQQRVEEIEKRLGQLDQERIRVEAEAAGLERERETILMGLRGATRAQPDVDRKGMPRTEAILAVLERSGDTLSLSEILDSLEKEGREDSYAVVSATLSHLVKVGRVRRAGRGLYLSARTPGATGQGRS